MPISQVTKLNLEGNQVGKTGAQALAAALPTSQVNQLDLRENGIRAEGKLALKRVREDYPYIGILF